MLRKTVIVPSAVGITVIQSQKRMKVKITAPVTPLHTEYSAHYLPLAVKQEGVFHCGGLE